MDYLLDILMPVYNHESYIEEAIKGVVQQKTNFKFRLLIGEDCSTDNSKNIIEQYRLAYPEIIFPFYREKNLGAYENSRLLFNQMESKYIALCEGDDYWVSTSKLQKQVDFLQKNDQYIICFTRGLIKNNFTNAETVNSDIAAGTEFTIPDVIRGNNQLTVTAVFKRNPDFKMPAWFPSITFGDWALYLLLMHTYVKKAYCLPDISAVYRIHSAGMHGNLHASNEKLINAYKMHLAFYNDIAKYLFKGQHQQVIDEAVYEKVNIITSLYCNDNKVIKAIGLNLKYALKSPSLKSLLIRLFSLQKQYAKSILHSFQHNAK